MDPRLSAAGYVVVPGALHPAEIEGILRQLPELDDAAGTRRLLEEPWCRELAAHANVVSPVHDALGTKARPVRALLFDKAPNANWSLGWHQDLKIAVARRVDVPGFGAWSVKEGVPHCRPTRQILEACLAVRIHLDCSHRENGPLRVLAGTHRDGIRVAPEPWELDREEVVLADAGAIVLMRPLLFHASSKATIPTHRRVIHIEFSSARLPGGLDWAY